jgi:RNA polymerase sigma-B factor
VGNQVSKSLTGAFDIAGVVHRQVQERPDPGASAIEAIGPEGRKGVKVITSTVAAPAPRNTLSERDEPSELLKRWRQTGDPRAHELLVRRFTPLARSLARRYAHTSEPFEDLMQVASLGLLKALDRFDPDRTTAFASFAVPTILGELRRYFRDSSWGVHMPRDLQERALQVGGAQEELTKRNGRAPTVNELAIYLELGTEEILDALQAAQAYDAVPLDAPAGSHDKDEGMTLLDALGEEDERYAWIDLDATLAIALKHLPPRERAIIRLRFIAELSQLEIAHRIGISQMQVSRLLRQSLEQLRILTNAQDEEP